MKKQQLKKIFSYMALLAIIGYTNVSNAHIYAGTMINKTTQVLTVECPADAVRLAAQVQDRFGNSGIMSVVMFKDGSSQTVSDLQQANPTYSAFTTLEAGPGLYYMIATHTAPVTDLYRIQYHCERADGSEPVFPNAILIQG